jgi:hypothetical protein
VGRSLTDRERQLGRAELPRSIIGNAGVQHVLTPRVVARITVEELDALCWDLGAYDYRARANGENKRASSGDLAHRRDSLFKILFCITETSNDLVARDSG